MVYLELSRLTTRSFQVLQVHEHRQRSSAERQDRIILHISHGKPVLSPGRTLLPISGFTLGIDILCFQLYYLCIQIASSTGQEIGGRLSRWFLCCIFDFRIRGMFIVCKVIENFRLPIRTEMFRAEFSGKNQAVVLFGR